MTPDHSTPAQRAAVPADMQLKMLQTRAITLLSQREHSRQELARKLAPHAPDADTLAQLLDKLTWENWLSDARYAQSLAHRQAPRQGTQRIVHTLRQHGIDEDSVAELTQQLRDTELERARAIWVKKFGSPPANAKEYARQLRFMGYRGFSLDILRRIIADAPDFADCTA